jgi:hypothetical protein
MTVPPAGFRDRRFAGATTSFGEHVGIEVSEPGFEFDVGFLLWIANAWRSSAYPQEIHSAGASRPMPYENNGICIPKGIRIKRA